MLELTGRAPREVNVLRRPPKSIGWAVLAAAALHASLWWAWPGAGVTGGVRAPLVSATTWSSAGEHLVSLVVRAESRADEPASPPDAAVPAPTHEAVTGNEAALRPASSLGGPAWLAGTYLDADQVERSPRPVHGWFLDEDALLAVGRTRLLIKLWVSAQGHIDHVEVLQAQPSGDWVGRALRTLPATPMEPATQDGRAVASVTVVELQTENEQVH